MKSPPSPRRVQSLNGLWDIAPGTIEPRHGAWKSHIPVPSLVDCAEPVYDWKSSSYHWYHLSFRVEAPHRREKATLRIGQAMFGTEVWLNGTRLGGDIACYTSQEYDAGPLLRFDGPNDLLVRVGLKETLPSESAVGNDQERETFIPGIWGDVALISTGNPRAALVQVIPRLRESNALVNVTIHNDSPAPVSLKIVSHIREHVTGHPVGRIQESAVLAGAAGESVHSIVHSVDPLRTWSPDHPFLYDHCADVVVEGEVVDTVVTRFGMREFRIQDGGFYLNGERIFLKGGNIAFHRFLSDAERRLLPWNLEWVRKLLIDIPRRHNFNFFRAHIGQMYGRWYDIADEGGMLLQNEWMFWKSTGTKEQITKEFTRWLRDNWNHPSIIIWDPLNESSDLVIQHVIVPEMKELDPTRPWESVDFIEEHPYIYSLGPVLNPERFGFARGLTEIEDSQEPAVVNEFLWWWLDRENNPSKLTLDVVERWLGSGWTKEELIARQSFLASELVELFRRMRVDAIQPFVYLSNSAGPTGNWFLGDIEGLVPKPLLGTLKNAFSPFAVSVELWDRHFLPGEKRTVRIFLFNDDPVKKEGRLRYGFVPGGEKLSHEPHERVSVDPSACSILPAHITFPENPGSYEIVAELTGPAGTSAFSRKIVHVVADDLSDPALSDIRCFAADPRGEVIGFLSGLGFRVAGLGSGDPAGADCILVCEEMLRDPAYVGNIPAITGTVRSGASLILIEPEFGNRGHEKLDVIDGLSLTIERRTDVDKGGYDSYVFPVDPQHPLWKDIPPEHLRMFNGAYGGEIVSQHTVTPDVPMEPLARCGLKLAHAAVMFMRAGRGCVVVSRIQTRGRLSGIGDPDHLFSRRRDPVARRYMRNLVTAFLNGGRSS